MSETKNPDMNEFLRAFEVWIVTNDPQNPDAIRLTDFDGGHLKARTRSDDTYYLFIKMKETAGDYFQNKTYTGIGITVHATQGNKDVME